MKEDIDGMMETAKKIHIGNDSGVYGVQINQNDFNKPKKPSLKDILKK